MEVIALLVLGIGLLLIGSFAGNWQRIYYFSTQICLSCMGLV
ncbi:MAG: hypothetical protein ABIK18_03595 [candidate division WOR-3 bacterium]